MRSFVYGSSPVMRLMGKAKPLLLIAAVMRSRLSLLVPSGKPTMGELGQSPRRLFSNSVTSTSMGWASTPSTVADKVLEIIATNR